MAAPQQGPQPPGWAAAQQMVGGALAVARAENASLRTRVRSLQEAAERTAREKRSHQRRVEGDAATQQWQEWWARARARPDKLLPGEEPPALDMDKLSDRNLVRCMQAAKVRVGLQVI